VIVAKFFVFELLFPRARFPDTVEPVLPPIATFLELFVFDRFYWTKIFSIPINIYFSNSS